MNINHLNLSVGLVCAYGFYHVNTSPVADDIPTFLIPKECGPDEVLTYGVEPTCEPSCDDPKPICAKVFVIMDEVPCFCKSPLVRNKATKKCVRLEECPNKGKSSRP